MVAIVGDPMGRLLRVGERNGDGDHEDDRSDGSGQGEE